MNKLPYRESLRALQIELVKLQRHMIEHDYKILVLLEGRDAAGKDGAIKRIVEHLSPRETRVVALQKPTERENGSWYFQRYVPHLPATDEFVVFNRSWYNRAGVERVMGFCTDAQYEEFMATVLHFERMLVGSGIRFIKYYLDISRAEQKKRLAERHADPLKQWKISPIDAVANKKWKAYSKARDEMLARTDCELTPWTIVRGDDKKAARLNLIRDLLSRLPYDDKRPRLLKADPEIVFRYEEAAKEALAP
jgi:polyphosphate kinase 2